MDLISRQGVPHKHILTWTPSGTDTLSFLDGGDGNSIGRLGMVGLFEYLFFSLPSLSSLISSSAAPDEHKGGGGVIGMEGEGVSAPLTK